MIGDIKQYIQKCIKYQQERDYYKKKIEYEIERLKEI